MAAQSHTEMAHLRQTVADADQRMDSRIAGLQTTVESGLADLDATFRWGVSELLMGVGGLATQLDDLKQLVRTPSQAGAYEQYEIARDEFRRNLFDEAVTSVERAINGFGGNPGYRSEFRFHSLLGLIYLGSESNTDPGTVNPGKAESAFLLAARYAEAPADAAVAWLSAGRAAYLQRAFDRAIEHTQKSIRLNPKLGQAHFQMAKTLCVRSLPEEGMKYLRTAIVLDRNFLIRSEFYRDILVYKKYTVNLFTEMRD